MIANGAPCGSVTIANRPTGIVVGGIETRPPSSTTRATVASVSPVAK